MRYFPDMCDQYKKLLDDVKEEFESQKANPILDPNFPQKSGRVFWSRSVITRARIPYIKLTGLK